MRTEKGRIPVNPSGSRAIDTARTHSMVKQQTRRLIFLLYHIYVPNATKFLFCCVHCVNNLIPPNVPILSSFSPFFCSLYALQIDSNPDDRIFNYKLPTEYPGFFKSSAQQPPTDLNLLVSTNLFSQSKPHT